MDDWAEPGRVYGYLTVIRRSDRRRYAVCRCVCGTEKLVYSSNLRSGCIKSCGCMKGKATRRKHGEANGSRRTKEYRTWAHIRARCTSPSDSGFKNYGGRGIAVSAEWASDFAAFLRDMGRAPGPQFTIERINNDGPYARDNCRWAPNSEQSKNTRRVIKIDGMCLADYCRKHGLKYGTVLQRYRRGASLEQAIGVFHD